MRRLMAIGGALMLMLGSAVTTHAVVVPLKRPASVGSQLIFYFDARQGFTTFATISQISFQSISIKVDFYTGNFDGKTAQVFTLAPNEQRIIDIGDVLGGRGFDTQSGLAVATITDEAGRALEFPALTGSFTVANLATGSAWGAPAAARSARNVSDGAIVQLNTVVDGTTVAFQSFQSRDLILPNFYNPQTLAPVSAHGNQVIFVNFANDGSGGAVKTSTTAWRIDATRANQEIFSDTVTTFGVNDVDLVTLLGDGANGSSGGIFFRTDDIDVGDSHLIYFAEALGTFGTGYLVQPTAD